MLDHELPVRKRGVSMDTLMNMANLARCTMLLDEVDQILLANGQGVLAAHLSTVIELLQSHSNEAIWVE